MNFKETGNQTNHLMHHEIILIDDDEFALYLQEMVLCNFIANKQPYLFNNAQDALSFLDDQSPEISNYLIFLDINMPTMNGWEFLEKLKTHPLRNFLRVIMVSSSTEKKEKEYAFSNELVEDFLVKPLTEEQLVCLQARENLHPFFASNTDKAEESNDDIQ
ncbi:response regulator [Pedobacter aquatilis]|uniref:response regulator n=1 Tax=Pedobacter aquatilis TaxID=351343 RepID=UPI00292E26E0|nr:response regulator [Pedobacter aquatilis]